MSRIRIEYSIYAVMGCILACSLICARAAGLPDVTVLGTGELLAKSTTEIRFTLEQPGTRVFRINSTMETKGTKP